MIMAAQTGPKLRWPSSEDSGTPSGPLSVKSDVTVRLDDITLWGPEGTSLPPVHSQAVGDGWTHWRSGWALCLSDG